VVSSVGSRPLGGRTAAAAAGVLADLLLGEPPLRPHPVSAFGMLMSVVEGRLYGDSRWRGVLHAGVGVGVGLGAGLTLRRTAVATYLAVASRALSGAAGEVGAALAAGDNDAARRLLPALVGRDTENLDEAGIVRAVVESVAENTVDAVVAPACYGALGGASGALAYRAVNTMDACVGHRNARYRRYGWAAARLDDVANYLPARLTAALVAAVRPARAGEVWRAVRRDAPGHPSPNAGVAEAAFAAALGVELGGATSYQGRVEQRPALGRGRLAERRDIDEACRLSRDVSLALAGLLAAISLVGGVGRVARGREHG